MQTGERNVEMDKTGSNSKEKGLPDEIAEPPVETGAGGGEHKSSNEEHQNFCT